MALLWRRDADRLPHLPRAGVHLDLRSALVALGLSRVLFSPPVNGARRWFGVGGTRHPAVGARQAGRRSSSSPRCSSGGCTASTRSATRCCRSASSCVGLVGLILLEPDFGTSMSLAADRRGDGVRRRAQLRATSSAPRSCALPAIYIVVMGAAYRRRRMLAFLNPWDDPLGDGFQIIQSLIAVGTGGVWGKGLMNGVQKLFYLPEPHTDFIYSVISEELGLIGATRGAALLLRHHLARPARGAARAGQLRRVPRARADDDGGGAGVREHQRRARPDADQGHSAAVRQLRRIVAADQPARDGHSAERVAARVDEHDGDERGAARRASPGGGTGGHLYPGSRWRASCWRGGRTRRSRLRERRAASRRGSCRAKGSRST